MASARDRMKRGGTTEVLISRLDSLIAMANKLYVTMRGHNPHKVDDTTNVTTYGVVNAQAACQTLLNDLKTKYGAHLASTTHHVAADATNTIASANMSDVATGVTLANEMKGDFNAHIILMTAHIEKDNSMLITTVDATVLGDLLVLVNDILVAYHNHLRRDHLAAGLDVPTLDAPLY
jgi:hypothetical protein